MLMRGKRYPPELCSRGPVPTEGNHFCPLQQIHFAAGPEVLSGATRAYSEQSQTAQWL
jgi:hypothetical protein